MRASEEEKSEKCAGPKSHKPLKIILRHLDSTPCAAPEGFPWGCARVQAIGRYSTGTKGRGGWYQLFPARVPIRDNKGLK